MPKRRTEMEKLSLEVFGQNMKSVRETKGMSIVDMSKKLGHKDGHRAWAIENARSTPFKEELDKICEVLECTPKDLFEGEVPELKSAGDKIVRVNKPNVEIVSEVKTEVNVPNKDAKENDIAEDERMPADVRFQNEPKPRPYTSPNPNYKGNHYDPNYRRDNRSYQRYDANREIAADSTSDKTHGTMVEIPVDDRNSIIVVYEKDKIYVEVQRDGAKPVKITIA